MNVTDWLKEWVVPLSAGTTFLLAIAAFLAIWQNHSLQKRERKERLLNEIIEWAIDVANLGHEENIISLPDASEDGVDEYDMIGTVLKTLSAIAARCQIITTRSIYVEAGAYDISNSLGVTVTQTISKLSACSKRLKTTIMKSKGIPRFKGQELAELRQCARCVIEEATKSKPRDIE